MTRDELFERFLFLLRQHMPPQPAPEYEDEPEEINLYTIFKDLGMDGAMVEELRLDAARAFDADIPQKPYLGVLELFGAICDCLPQDEDDDF